MNLSGWRRNAMLLLALLLLGSTLAACTVSTVGGLTGALLTVAAALALLVGTGASTAGCGDDDPATDPVEDINVGPCLSVPAPDEGTTPTDVPDAVQPADAADTADPGEEPEIGPCLSPLPPDAPDADEEPDIGPCLSPPLEDVNDDIDEPEPDIGPCLEPPPPDDVVMPDDEGELDIGPCLDPLPEDISEPDEGEPDIGPCLSPPEPDVGPCLSPPAPDAGSGDKSDVEMMPCLSLPPPDTDEASVPQPVDPATARAEARAAIRARLARSGVLPPSVAARLASKSRAGSPDGDDSGEA